MSPDRCYLCLPAIHPRGYDPAWPCGLTLAVMTPAAALAVAAVLAAHRVVVEHRFLLRRQLPVERRQRAQRSVFRAAGTGAARQAAMASARPQATVRFMAFLLARAPRLADAA